MKPLNNFLASVAFCGAFAYLFTVFVTLNLNPFQWQPIEVQQFLTLHLLLFVLFIENPTIDNQ